MDGLSYGIKKSYIPASSEASKGMQVKLVAGKGKSYHPWAIVENLKRMVKTKLYMDEHRFSYEAMADRKAELLAKEKEHARE